MSSARVARRAYSSLPNSSAMRKRTSHVTDVPDGVALSAISSLIWLPVFVP